MPLFHVSNVCLSLKRPNFQPAFHAADLIYVIIKVDCTVQNYQLKNLDRAEPREKRRRETLNRLRMHHRITQLTWHEGLVHMLHS